MGSTLPPGYFAELYAGAEDPWRISTGWYERRKRDLVLAALPRERFAVAVEPGCSNGELSVLLAGRCDRLVAWDVVGDAVTRTRARLGDRAGVEVRQGGLPDDWPDGKADLIVVSELGYYLDEPDLTRAVAAAVDHLTADGSLLAVHWRHAAEGYPLSGDRVHAVIDAHPALTRLGGYCDEDFLLDVWTHGEAISVARQVGVL
jgi:hypothetical protein